VQYTLSLHDALPISPKPQNPKRINSKMSFMKLQLQGIFPRRETMQANVNTSENNDDSREKIASSASTIGLKQSNSHVSSK